MAASVLRGLSPPPFAFGPLADDAPTDQPTFTPFSVTSSSDLDDAFQAGHQQGADEAAERLAALEAEVASLRAALTEAGDSDRAHTDLCRETGERLSAEWAEGIKSLEPALAALALDAAQAVLDAPLSDVQRSAAERALSAAIDTIAGGPPVTVTLHPIDLLRFQESGLAGALDATHPGMRWEADAGLAEGDWSVSTSDAAVRRVRTAMVAALRERLGLAAATS